MLVTFTGRQMDPLHPHIKDISIMDIAHSLANTCRFNGHCSEFYSVAQHSFLVSKLVPKHAALWGLLHDAAEAYIGDIIRPIKGLSEMDGIKKIERNIEECIILKYGVKEYPEVKEMDSRLLITEMLSLRLYQINVLPGVNPIKADVLPCWSPREAEGNFMCRFDELYCGRVD